MARKTMTHPSIGAHPRRVFVDTGGWYGITSERDRWHAASAAYYRRRVEARTQIVTSDYVLDETLTRLRYDFGHQLALAFWGRITKAQSTGRLLIVSVDTTVWSAAIDIFTQYDDQDFSFTDCTSFVLAKRELVDEVFSFDHHFRHFGLIVQPGV